MADYIDRDFEAMAYALRQRYPGVRIVEAYIFTRGDYTQQEVKDAARILKRIAKAARVEARQ